MKETMEKSKQVKKKKGRVTEQNPAVYRFTFRLDAVQLAAFQKLFEQSGMPTKTAFIIARLFDNEFKVMKIDKSALDYYSKLSTFYAQFRAIGVNYNQVVKALNTHFTEKKALASLYKLEKITIELVGLNRQIIELTQKFEQRWSQK